ILHVNNLSSAEILRDDSERAREKSREVLLNHLASCSHNDYQLQLNQEEIARRIAECQIEAEEERKREEMESAARARIREEERERRKKEEITRKRETSNSSNTDQPSLPQR